MFISCIVAGRSSGVFIPQYEGAVGRFKRVFMALTSLLLLLPDEGSAHERSHDTEEVERGEESFQLEWRLSEEL